jgi:hypothetical protein
MPKATAAEIRRLLQAGHPCIRIATSEEPEAAMIAHEVAKELSWAVVEWSAVAGVMSEKHLAKSSNNKPQEGQTPSENPAAALWLLRHELQTDRSPRLIVLYDMIEHLNEARTGRAMRELLFALERERSQGINTRAVVMIDHRDDAPLIVSDRSMLLRIPLPDEKQTEALAWDILKAQKVMGVQIDWSKRQFERAVKTLRGLTRRQMSLVLAELAGDRQLNADDMPKLLEAKRRVLFSGGGGLELVEAPATMDEIGGLSRMKAWLTQRSQLLSSDAASFGLTPPRGLLLVGVQGAGKSLAAKAIATAWQHPLLRLDAGSLYDKYVGESERRLRAALEQAEAMSPVVLWIDEIEKAFAAAASQSTDGGLSKRMFGTLLTWMQEHREPVFLVATANDIEALPPELLRKGRFDEIFFVDLPNEQVREMILGIHLRKRKRDPLNFDLKALAAACAGYSGAEIEAAVVSGLTTAFSTKREPTTQDILEAIQGTKPLSVTSAEKIERLREWGRERCVPADEWEG